MLHGSPLENRWTDQFDNGYPEEFLNEFQSAFDIILDETEDLNKFRMQ